MIRWMLTAVAMTLAGAALAKLPPPDEAAKAKAAETAAKTAWQGKVDLYLLCKAQDKVAAYYKAHPKPAAAGTAPATAGTTTAAAPAAAGATSAAPAVAAAPAAAPVAATNPTAASPTTASQGGSTPVATVGTPATGAAAGAATAAATIGTCADPGPFAYAPPDQKPLETSGAHSPAATAASPPSVRAESGSMTSGKTGGTPKQ